MMLIGIVFSSGYSKVLSKNTTGLLWSQQLPDEINTDNLLLFLNEPRPMVDYSLTYKGIRKYSKEAAFLDIDYLRPTNHPLEIVAIRDFESSNGTKISKGDTIRLVNGENSYFEVIYTVSDGQEFTLFPRVQQNKNMGTVYSPDIKRTLTADLYTHVRIYPDPEEEPTWSDTELVTLRVGDPFFVNDYTARFVGMEPLKEIDGKPLKDGDVAVKAVLEIEGEYETYTAEPICATEPPASLKFDFFSPKRIFPFETIE
ncbi:MAG: hypothetical protein AAFN93_28085 [Bacteroidota bacterium]